MNRLNGGSFGQGAAIGGGMTGLGEIGKGLIAPAMMRSAIGGGIGKDTANAVLKETKGIRPSTVLKNTSSRIAQASDDLDEAIAAANERSAPRIRGFLMPPVEETPLSPAPSPRNPRMRPMAFPAKINPEGPMEARSGNPMADISEYPGINPHYLSGSEHPELSGRVTPLQNPQQVTTRMGVLLRRPEMSASIPSTYQPNRMFSMEAAKSPIRSALSLAGRQRVPEDAAQLRGMIDFLEGTGEYGPERPAAMTPQEMLEARRGYGRNFISNRQWNQTANSPVMAAAKQGYGGLTSELHTKVPGSIEADQMMENLIPAKQALKAMVKRDPSVGVNVMGRMGARTGALTSAAMGRRAAREPEACQARFLEE